MSRAGKKELCADQEFDELAKKWNESVRSCMGDMPQQELTDRLNEEFGHRTSFSQPVINKWLSVNRNQMFPRYEIMAKMARVLGVSVSRLTGETTFDSIPAQMASEYTGLSNEALRSLRKATREFGSPFAGKYMRKDEFNEEAVQLVNAMLTSEKFLDVLLAMKQLSDAIRRTRDEREASFRRIEERYGIAAFRKAEHLPPIDEEESFHEYWVNNESALIKAGITEDEIPDLMEIAAKIDSAADDYYVKDQEGEVWDLACRYQVSRAFDRLLDDVFPPDYPMGS